MFSLKIKIDRKNFCEKDHWSPIPAVLIFNRPLGLVWCNLRGFSATLLLMREWSVSQSILW